jgi:DNA-binding transcriptional LysR family regulator
MLADSKHCRLSVGCLPHLRLQQLQAFLGALYARTPDLDAEVFHLSSSEQYRRLHNAELELALLDVPASGDEVRTRPLYPGDPLAVFLPLHHPLAACERLGAGALAGRRLLTSPNACDPAFHALLMSHVGEYGFGAVLQRGGHDVRDLLFAVAEGQGLTIAPKSLHRVFGDVGSLLTTRPLDPPRSMPDTLLAWRADPPAHLRGVVATAQEEARRLRAAADVRSERLT